jgi:photoactive yellow protein
MSEPPSDTAAGVSALDRLSPEDLDRLPYGAIQVDGDGVIRFYNRAEARLSGRDRDRVLGRNFFLDVAPCTNMPSFFGRFREGVDAGALDVGFDYVFAFRMAPVRVHIRMCGPTDEGLYWILVEPLERLQPPAQRDAAPAGPRVAVDETVRDFTACDREPIHVPAAIQPHGTLLVADGEAGRVLSAAANLDAFLGVRAEDALGRDLAEVLPAGIVASMRAAAADGTLGAAPPLKASMAGPDGRRLDAAAHRWDGRVLVEIEPEEDDRPPLAVADPRNLVPHALARLHAADGVEFLSQDLVRVVREATGFDRVLLYRFDRDWHGEAVAEAKATDWAQSLVGLHFPASDIPRQARTLYRTSRVRQMPDAGYEAVPLVPSEDPRDGSAIDLSHARLRSMSPRHRDYHAGMGVAGSFSVSLVLEDRLWGLLVGHHRSPRRLGQDQLDALWLLAEVAAPRLEAGETRAVRANRRRHRDLHARFIERVAAAGDLRSLTAVGDPSLLELFHACGGAGAMMEGRWTPQGRTPPEDAVRDLLAWAAPQADQEVFASDCLPAVFPRFHDLGEAAAGALILFLDRQAGSALVWFRPELAQVVAWAGDPRKGGQDEDGVPSPRRSFDRWVEARRGYARSWPGWKLDLARELRHAVNDVVAKAARRIAELNQQLERSNAAKSQFLASMSHELRTPLNAIIGFSDMLGAGIAGELRPKQTEYVGHILSAGRHLLDLVNEVLDLSRLEAGQYVLHEETVDVAAAVRDALDFARPAARERAVSLIDAVPAGLPALVADRRALRQILLNLLSNAVKFTLPGGRVRVEAEATADGLRLCVADSGVGIPADRLDDVLEPFVQVEDPYSRSREGTGLGLAIVKRLAEAHGAHLRIQSGQGEGTRAAVVFPPERMAR